MEKINLQKREKLKKSLMLLFGIFSIGFIKKDFFLTLLNKKNETFIIRKDANNLINQISIGSKKYVFDEKGNMTEVKL